MKKTLLPLCIILIQLSYCIAQTDSSDNFYYISRVQNEKFDRSGKNGHDYKQFKRWEWYTSTRLRLGGKLANNTQLNQEALQSSSVNRSLQTEANTGSWSFIGPTSVNSSDKGIGRANRIAFHPTNVNTLYVAGATGGLWISTDAGANWYSYSEGIPNMSLSGVVVDPTNPSIIYILTGDADAVNSGARGQFSYGKTSIGVLKSFDGGFTWHKTGLQWNETDNYVGYKLMMHPTNPSILMVATNVGIFRSIDGGNSWTSQQANKTFFDLEFHPTNSSIVYASGTDADSVVIYKSVNSGLFFTKTHALERVNNADGTGAVNRSALGVSAANANNVYLLAGPATAAGSFHGVYRSTDAGETFSLRTNTPNILGGSSTGADSKDQESYDLAIAVSPSNTNNIACGGIRLWTSSNGGSSFSFQDDYVSAASYYHADIHDLAYHPLDNSKLYMCGDGGVYISTDGGDNWSALNNNLQLTQYYKIATNPASGSGFENIMIGGTQDNGTNKRSSGGGGNFQKILGGDGMDCLIDPDAIGTYIASTQDGVFYYSSNSGSTFQKICDPESVKIAIGSNVTERWVTPVAEISGNSNQFVLGYNPTILVSKVSSTFVFTKLGWSGLSFVKTARNNANRIYVGDNGYAGIPQNVIKTSTDLGGNWRTVLVEPNHLGIPATDLAFNADNGNQIWITFGGYNASKKVWYTADGGTTWSNVTGSLPNVPINCIVFDDNNGNPAGAVYIGTDIGVFYRDDNLGDWIPFSNGLPVVEITDLEIHEAEGLLRAGTYGRGIWETSIYSNCPSGISLTSANTAIFKPYYFQAAQTITSSAQHHGYGANVNYKAGNSITLTPGFSASAAGGNIFQGKLGPCGGGVPSNLRSENEMRIRGVLVD